LGAVPIYRSWRCVMEWNHKPFDLYTSPPLALFWTREVSRGEAVLNGTSGPSGESPLPSGCALGSPNPTISVVEDDLEGYLATLLMCAMGVEVLVCSLVASALATVELPLTERTMNWFRITSTSDQSALSLGTAGEAQTVKNCQKSNRQNPHRRSIRSPTSLWQTSF